MDTACPMAPSSTSKYNKMGNAGRTGTVPAFFMTLLNLAVLRDDICSIAKDADVGSLRHSPLGAPARSCSCPGLWTDTRGQANRTGLPLPRTYMSPAEVTALLFSCEVVVPPQPPLSSAGCYRRPPASHSLLSLVPQNAWPCLHHWDATSNLTVSHLFPRFLQVTRIGCVFSHWPSS